MGIVPQNNNNTVYCQTKIPKGKSYTETKVGGDYNSDQTAELFRIKNSDKIKVTVGHACHDFGSLSRTTSLLKIVNCLCLIIQSPFKLLVNIFNGIGDCIKDSFSLSSNDSGIGFILMALFVGIIYLINYGLNEIIKTLDTSTQVLNHERDILEQAYFKLSTIATNNAE